MVNPRVSGLDLIARERHLKITNLKNIRYLEWAVQSLLPLVEIEAVVKLELG